MNSPAFYKYILYSQLQETLQTSILILNKSSEFTILIPTLHNKTGSCNVKPQMNIFGQGYRSLYKTASLMTETSHLVRRTPC